MKRNHRVVRDTLTKDLRIDQDKTIKEVEEILRANLNEEHFTIQSTHSSVKAWANENHPIGHSCTHEHERFEAHKA